MATPTSGTNWEDLRKQARQLENEIDLKLVSFSKLGTSHGNTGYKSDSSDTVPLLSGEHMFETMALEIEQLLAKNINGRFCRQFPDSWLSIFATEDGYLFSSICGQ